MTDFSVPRRMGWNAFLIIFLKDLKNVGSTVGIFMLISILNSDLDIFDVSDLLRLLGCVLLCLVISLFVALSKFLPKKFHVSDGNLIFTHGLFHSQTTTIPLHRIHSLRTRRGLVYQMLEMRGIAFDTLASKTEEIELILGESDWQSLIRQIENEESVGDMATNEAEPRKNGVFVYFKNKYLIEDAFCQNHLKGVAVLVAFLWAVFNRIFNDFDDVGEYAVRIAGRYEDTFVLTPSEIVMSLVVIYIFVMFLWIGKALLVYYDMTASIDRSLLTFSRGLFSRMTSRFSHDKVCTASVKRNFLERRFGLCTLWLKQALFATSKKEEDNIRIYSSDESLVLLKWWLGDEYESEDTLFVAKSGRGTLIHCVAPGVVVSVVATFALCCLSLYVWMALPVLCLVFVLWRGVCAMRHSSISLRETYLEVGNGSFADVKNYIRYDDVEVVLVRRTPFSPWSHRVAIAVATPGSSFIVRSIKEDEAAYICEFLVRNSSRYK